MADLVEIQQLLARYCWAHDSQDVEALTNCFSKDIQLFGVTGRDVVVNYYREGYKQLTARRRHVLSNFIMLEDGEDEAVVQSYITLYLIRDDKLELHLTGVYRDTVVREDGAWRLRSRDATMDVPYDPGDANRAPAANYPGR